MIQNTSVEAKETVSVLCNHDDQPVAFIWRGTQYLVSSRPIRWYARRCWWVDFDSANRQSAASLEIEIWRLRASCEQGTGFFELEHLQPEDEWRLIRVLEE